jgi:hypothetical protein
LARETSEEVELSNNVIIATLSSDYRSLRGFTGIAAIVDEVAFLSIEGQKPDTEVVRALRSRLLTTQGPLICISSPYAKRGMLYEVYKKHYGQNSNILVWQGHSKLMNPTLSDTMIAEMLAEDATGAFADLGLGFRSDIETFLLREVVENLIVPERFELAPVHGIQYVAFADPSGGSQDSMTLGIAHREGDALVLDLLRESRPPFSPDQVVQQFAETLKQYGLTTVTGDKYGGLWPSERFQVHGIDYQVSKLSKSDLYRELLPLMNSGQVELLDHERLVNQLINLERRVARGGKDSIDHPRGGRDDLANVCAGALTLLAGKRDAGPVFIGLLDPISMKIESTTSATEHETTGRRQPRRI